VDLIPGDITYWYTSVAGIPSLQAIQPLETPNQEALAIDSLTLEQYHKICYWTLSRPRHIYCSASATVNLSAIVACAPGHRLEDSVQMALLPDAEVYLGHWTGMAGQVNEDGWTRYYCCVLAVW
jgi:hypothetical protein